jgi:hypothetical protein
MKRRIEKAAIANQRGAKWIKWNTRSGLTLVEVLIAALLGATVGLLVTQTTRQILLMSTRISHRTLAWERGQNVLSILEPRVLHAAFGISYERTGTLFQRSFGGVSGSGGPPPSQWTDRGPLQIWRGQSRDSDSLWDLAPEIEGVHRGRGLAVLYAIPSALSAKLTGNKPLPVNAEDKNPTTIELIPKENLGRMEDRLPTKAKNDLRSWVIFPLTQLPLYASDYSNGKLKVRIPEKSGLSSTLYPYDELHYLRAERFQVKSASLQSENLQTSWRDTDLESRVEGVLEMWFEWTPSKHRLEVWILTTGGGVSFGKPDRPKDWPAEAPWRSEFQQHDLTVVRKSWFLENL